MSERMEQAEAFARQNAEQPHAIKTIISRKGVSPMNDNVIRLCLRNELHGELVAMFYKNSHITIAERQANEWQNVVLNHQELRELAEFAARQTTNTD